MITTSIRVPDHRPFYDCNIPPEKGGYICKELSDDIYVYEKLIAINRVEVINSNGRVFSSFLQDSTYEISIQDDGRTLKLFEKADHV